MEQIDLIKIYKMIFIFNALKNGWTVKMIENNKYEFKKSKEKEKTINVDDYLKNFIKKNLDINDLLNY